jgi:hypothetical protein
MPGCSDNVSRSFDGLGLVRKKLCTPDSHAPSRLVAIHDSLLTYRGLEHPGAVAVTPLEGTVTIACTAANQTLLLPSLAVCARVDVGPLDGRDGADGP